MSLKRQAVRFVNEMRSASRYAENTLRAYSIDMDAYTDFLHAQGVASWSLVRSGHVRDFMVAQAAHGRSAASMSRRLAAIKSLHSFLADSGQMAHDPARLVRSVRVGQRLPRALAAEDIGRIVDACDGSPLGMRDRCVIELLYSSGLRAAEMLGVELADVDMGARILRVTGKGGRERLVPFGERAAAALATYLERGRPGLMCGRAGESLVVARGGAPICRTALAASIKKRARAAGVTVRVHLHALRHSCASHCYANDMDIYEIKELLGHRSIAATLIYTEMDRSRLRASHRKSHPRG